MTKEQNEKQVEQEQKESTLVDTTLYDKGSAVDTGIDFKKYDGRKVNIKTVEVHDHPVNGLYVKVLTEPLDTIERDGEEKPIYASKLFGLVKQVDEKTQKPSICWSTQGNLQKFLTKYNKKHFDDLVGVEVLAVVEVNKANNEVLTIK